MQTLRVKLKDKSYQVYIKRGIVNELGHLLKMVSDAKTVAMITDKNINRLYGNRVLNALNSEGFDTYLIEVDPGEQSKSLTTLNLVYRELVKAKVTRKDLVLTLGGGVIGDLGGFAAATFLRGVPYVQVPTSLIAQVDSSIGGKVAVDLPHGKNLIGSFYHPEAVFIDPDFLQTLDTREFNNGMAEVIKYSCIKDRDLFENLISFSKNELQDNIEKIIFKCLNIKKNIVEQDENDHGCRMVLNFGHTLGHAIEKYFNYSRYAHGEAVSIGMYHVTKNSESMGLTEPGTSIMLKEMLQKFGLPCEMPPGDVSQIIDAIAVDKKSRGDSINIVLLSSIGESFIKSIKKEEIASFFL